MVTTWTYSRDCFYVPMDSTMTRLIQVPDRVVFLFEGGVIFFGPTRIGEVDHLTFGISQLDASLRV